MAPFQSPNYTQTPNDLFDELLPEMGLSELKVVLCIVRNTFGYHRDEVKMSFRAIARFTGLAARSVAEGVSQAETHELIERIVDGNKTTTWRAFVSVLPSSTPRTTRYHATVSPSSTLSGLKKERKKIKQNEEERAIIYSTYESEIGALTPFIADSIDGWIKDGFPEKWIYDAIRESSAQNKRNWKYIEAIIKRWNAQGNQNPVSGGTGKGKTQVEDDWLTRKEKELANGRS